jgi:hypothetical protein
MIYPQPNITQRSTPHFHQQWLEEQMIIDLDLVFPEKLKRKE